MTINLLHALSWLFILICGSRSQSIDDEMRTLAADIGDSFTTISEEHDHKVDWVFVVDHGGFNRLDLHLQYSNYFIQQLASHLYISPTYSQTGVITYGSYASVQIPLNIQTGNQCDFNRKVDRLQLNAGQSNMKKAMEVADDELRVNGRDSAHKVTVLITTAGWTNIGDNPYENVNKLKNLGTLIVIVLVFDRSDSIVAPVILSFASERQHALDRPDQPLSTQTRYAFELEAKRGNLRRLYRHFLLATQKKEYKPLQVPANFCSACADGEACVCDTNLFNTYHCEKDTYGPLITKGCPADMSAYVDPGEPYTRVSWLTPQAVDFSTSMQSEILAQHDDTASGLYLYENPTNFNQTTATYKAFIGKTLVTHRFYDGSGNSVNCSFHIEVYDNEKPIISNCPTFISVNTSGLNTQEVYWTTTTATDNSLKTPQSLLYVNGLARDYSNRTFHIGTSAVRLIFSDESLNNEVCNFDVEVVDIEPPVVVQCDGPNSTIYSSDTQAYVKWAEPEFKDNSGKPVNVTSNNKQDYYKIGKHVVTYTATDLFGNSGGCSFTFTVRGYPCPELPAPYNGAIICDNAVPGAVCQIFCENPYDFEPLAGQPFPADRYSCVGTGQWYPTNVVPHCVVSQRNKKLPTTYYYDGKCSDFNVSSLIKDNAVVHYEGFVQGRFFREAWGRQIASQDFNDPRCGAEAAITTPISTVTPSTSILPPFTTATRPMSSTLPPVLNTTDAVGNATSGLGGIVIG